jgi:hypothetical protein
MTLLGHLFEHDMPAAVLFTAFISGEPIFAKEDKTLGLAVDFSRNGDDNSSQNASLDSTSPLRGQDVVVDNLLLTQGFRVVQPDEDFTRLDIEVRRNF